MSVWLLVGAAWSILTFNLHQSIFEYQHWSKWSSIMWKRSLVCIWWCCIDVVPGTSWLMFLRNIICTYEPALKFTSRGAKWLSRLSIGLHLRRSPFMSCIEHIIILFTHLTPSSLFFQVSFSFLWLFGQVKGIKTLVKFRKTFWVKIEPSAFYSLKG